MSGDRRQKAENGGQDSERRKKPYGNPFFSFLSPLTFSLYSLTTRQRIGIATILVFGLAGISYGLAWAGIGSDLPRGGSLRIALALFFLWLAWPDLEQFPRWIFTTIPLVLILVAFWPKLLFVIVPLVFLLLFLQPKKAKPPRRRKK